MKIFIKDIFQGIKVYFSAFGYISKLKLWKHFLVPIFISFIVGLLIVASVYFLSSDIGNFISKIWIWKWGKETFITIAKVLGGIFIVATGLILYKHIVMALVSPLMSPVSEKIEAYFLGQQEFKDSYVQHRKTSFQEQLVRGVRVNIRNLSKEFFFTIILLLLGLIPVVNIISTILIFIVQAYYAGFGNMDYTLERHFNYKDSVKFVRKNRGLAIGNGILFVFLLLIPILGFIIVLPLSVTASSIQTIKRIHNE